MARPKQEVTQNNSLTIRLETSFKKRYISFCKKNKFIMAKRVREFMEEDLKENK